MAQTRANQTVRWERERGGEQGECKQPTRHASEGSIVDDSKRNRTLASCEVRGSRPSGQGRPCTLAGGGAGYAGSGISYFGASLQDRLQTSDRKQPQHADDGNFPAAAELLRPVFSPVLMVFPERLCGRVREQDGTGNCCCLFPFCRCLSVVVGLRARKSGSSPDRGNEPRVV